MKKGMKNTADNNLIFTKTHLLYVKETIAQEYRGEGTSQHTEQLKKEYIVVPWKDTGILIIKELIIIMRCSFSVIRKRYKFDVVKLHIHLFKLLTVAKKISERTKQKNIGGTTKKGIDS